MPFPNSSKPLKPLLKLNTSKKYYVRRIGSSTDKITQGKLYIVEMKRVYQDNYEWVIEKTDCPRVKTQPVLRVESDIWLVTISTDGTHYINTDTFDLQPDQKPEVKTMPEQLEDIKQGRIINGAEAEAYNDKQIIGFICDLRKREETLTEQIGTEAKYFKAKKVKWDAQMTLLTDELESRA